MKPALAGVAASGVSIPVVWDFLGYPFEAGPLVVTVCATLMTRLIVSLNTTGHRRRWLLDTSITGLCVIVSALWVQANHLSLLPAGISGIGFGALGVGVISLGRTQAAVAFRAAAQTFLRGLAAMPAKPADGAPADPDADLLDRLDKH